MSMYIEITDIEMHDLLTQNSKICVLDFYGDWCAPCKALAIELEENVLKNVELCKDVSTGSDDVDGKIVFAKINVSNCEMLASAYKIKSIPQTSFYKNGQLQSAKIIGKKTQEILDTIDELNK